MQRTMSFLAGVLAGAVVGAVAALLLTPASGEDLQAQIREQMDTVIAEAKAAAEERRIELEERFAALKAGAE